MNKSTSKKRKWILWGREFDGDYNYKVKDIEVGTPIEKIAQDSGFKTLVHAHLIEKTFGAKTVYQEFTEIR